MKKIQILIAILFLTKVSLSQITLQYQPCTDCQGANPVYSNVTDYSTWDLNSDFGMRRYESSKWHQGIDYNIADGNTNTDETGYHIIAPFDGRFTFVTLDNGYKYFIIQDRNNSNRNLGFGHIFSKNKGVTQKSGDMVLTKSDNGTWVIICLSTGIAYSLINGLAVEYDDVTYVTQNTCNAGDPIAPLGNSGGDNSNFDTHLHLYYAEDPTHGVSSSTQRNNAKNPLQIVNHANTNFDISIEGITNLTKYNQNSFYSGAEQGSIQVKIKMAGASNGSRYTNQVMDIEKVHFYIKKYGQNDSDYKLILGDNFDSKIVLGGRIDNTRYPSGNSSYDIASAYGSIIRTGIDPYAYNSYPYDNWYFSDIYTRIHKDDTFTGTIKLAISNAEARYPDGVYLIKPKAYRINNTEAINPANPNNNEPKQILIDNFRPYISNVKIKEYGEENYKYSRGWQWVNNSLLFEPEPVDIKFSSDKNVEVQVTTSEAMRKVKLEVGNYSVEQSNGNDLNKTTWNFTINKSQLTTGLHTLKLTGVDLAGNPLQSEPASIPIRQANGTWAPAPITGADTYHKFIFGISTVDFTATQLGIPVNTIRFQDESDCEYLCTYYWHFGNPAGNSSSQKDFDMTYINTGVYLVKHSVNNVEVSKYVSVNQLSRPISKFIFSPLYNANGGRSTEVKVNFFSTSEGIISSYFWDFGNGVTSTLKDPEDIILQINTPYVVKLTVTNATGPDTYVEEIYLDPTTHPFISIFDWELSYYLYDIDVSLSNFDLTYPVFYEIDYGDGTSENYESDYYSYHRFNHQYNRLGEFLVVASATGQNLSGGTVTVSNAKRIEVQPDYLDVALSYSSDNDPPYVLQNVTFTPDVYPSLSYWGFWNIFKIGDPLFYRSFPCTNSDPVLNYSFPEAGSYRIILDVTVSGSSGTGHGELDIEIENAPHYVEVSLYGRNTLSTTTSFTYEANLTPIGDPGVPDSDWWPTNLRWTLFYPNGSFQVFNDETFDFWESQFIHYRTFNFPTSGQYKLRVESWNNQHGYEENNLINPQYVNTISFYDFDEKDILVSDNLPALVILSPTAAFPPAVSADGNEDILLRFKNPGAEGIRWSVEQGTGLICNNCISIPQPSSGQNLANNNQISMTIDVLPNMQDYSRYSVLKISGLDANNNHVQGSPAYIQIDQNGMILWQILVEGNSPNHSFGTSISIDGLTAVVGAPSETLGMKGYAFIYQKNNYDEWERTATLMPSDLNKNFGKSVDISGDYVFISGEGSNKAYVFKKPVNGWSGNISEIKIIDNIFSNKNGINVSIWGDYAVIGAPYHDDRGVVLVYSRNEGGTDNWGHVKRFDGPANDDQYGECVDLYNDILAVGAPQGGWQSGYIKTYNRNKNGPDSWGLTSTLMHTGQGSHLPNMKFGQRVSVFNDALSTTFYYADEYNISYLFSNIYRLNGNGIFELHGVDARLLNQPPLMNLINSISLYKYVESENPDEYSYKAMMGSPFRWSDAGQIAYSYFELIPHLHYYFHWIDSPWLDPNLPNEQWGKGVSRSFNTDITGIPGYTRNSGKRGAVQFQRTSIINSNFEAGLEFEFVNFIKPTGTYSTVNASKIILGGNGMPAKVLNGAIIQYEAGEILLKNGFLADEDAIFTAKALKPKNKAAKKLEQEEYHRAKAEMVRVELLRSFQNAYPDYPWYSFDPYNELKLINIPETKSSQSDRETLQSSIHGLTKTQNMENRQNNSVIYIQGRDRKLMLPVIKAEPDETPTNNTEYEK